MSIRTQSNSSVLGKNEGYVPFKAWQRITPFKTMHEYTRSQNLGQTYNGVEKYKTMTIDGHTTGGGYAFEDLHVKAKVEAGHVIEKVAAIKNGADFIDNGEPVQLKYSRKGRSIAHSIFEHKGKDNAYGSYRYEGQTIVVPKGKKEYVDSHIRNRELNGYHDNIKPIQESTVACDEVDAYFYRGRESFMMDLQDLNLIEPAISCGLRIGVFGYALGRRAIKARCRKKGKEMTWKHKLLAVGCGCGTVMLSTASFLFIGCAARQNLRPNM